MLCFALWTHDPLPSPAPIDAILNCFWTDLNRPEDIMNDGGKSDNAPLLIYCRTWHIL